MSTVEIFVISNNRNRPIRNESILYSFIQQASLFLNKMRWKKLQELKIDILKHIGSAFTKSKNFSRTIVLMRIPSF